VFEKLKIDDETEQKPKTVENNEKLKNTGENNAIEL